MSVVIRPAREEDAPQAQAVMNEAKTLPMLGGFVMLEQLKTGFTKGNGEKGIHNIVAEVDGEILGVSQISPHDYHIEMGLVAVHEDHRQKGYGSSMYFGHVLRAALEGRLFLLDQVAHFNEVMRYKYMPALDFHMELLQRNKIRNWCSLAYYRYDLLNKGLQPWIERFNKTGFEIQVEDHDYYKQKFAENRDELLRQGREEDAKKIGDNMVQAKEFLGLLG
ncbi:GNAT family N-acetyltransferase [Streptomyces sp. CoH17]|uniref:GNAT family N-acetyltransferase n=1 Tax=Streptomyces sp. CoH17 TaxID=2992806 RepID=UPI002270A195|nr:GNAT family N-acetyltransferase [Streptomyces sp. CoH17]